MKRLPVIGAALAALCLATAGPVLAAVPSNDTYAGRAAIGALPFLTTADTTEATSDADDAEANAACGAPATDASVWYEYTAPADGPVLVETSGSSYGAGVIVATGSPGSFVVESCGPGMVAFNAVAGVAYAIVVFDDQFDGAGNGGTLELSVTEPPGAPTLDIQVNASGGFDARTGLATVAGTITCSGGVAEGKNWVEVQLSQLVGRIRLNASGAATFSCDGTTQPWSVVLGSDAGKFAGGKASVRAFAFACGIFECGDDEVQATVTLRK